MEGLIEVLLAYVVSLVTIATAILGVGLVVGHGRGESGRGRPPVTNLSDGAERQRPAVTTQSTESCDLTATYAGYGIVVCQSKMTTSAFTAWSGSQKIQPSARS